MHSVPDFIATMKNTPKKQQFKLSALGPILNFDQSPSMLQSRFASPKSPKATYPQAKASRSRDSPSRTKLSVLNRAATAAVEEDDESDASETGIFDALDHDESEGDVFDGLSGWIDDDTLITINDADVASAQNDEKEKGKIALVNSLSEPFAKHLVTLQREVVEAMQPAIKHSHLVLSHVSNDIEPEKLVKGGLEAYKVATTTWDAAVQNQLEELSEALADSQGRMKGLFEELQELEARREDWWGRVGALVDDTDLERAHTRSGDKVAEECSAGVEKTISLVDKKLKTTFSDGASGGVSKGRKNKGEMDHLKALMMSL
ncbi:hypothetical protein DL93DRAFT_2153404 [Clavulina sp. PMI_390]|nr:hypothetical protein DL93DRAFT_2153404 [Clavulina sp. PMI_390]